MFVTQLIKNLYNFVLAKPYILFLFVLVLSKEIYILEVETLVVACFFLFLFFLFTQISVVVQESLDLKYEQVRRDFYSYLFFLEILNNKLISSYSYSKFLISDIDNLLHFAQQYFSYIRTNKITGIKTLAINTVYSSLMNVINEQKLYKKTLILSILSDVFEKQLINK
uniref:ATP synthase F0 subunit b n=1 Tax=Gloeochaete wittrockiana TaxID=38269 RepID=A0A096Y6Q8_9EUKA|nr:ATP synthase F0 subunit b [Gloeochaete wittrockiana]AIM52016.1 ATP synthase F0 subunit b [Gloeochaete wittrockiana]